MAASNPTLAAALVTPQQLAALTQQAASGAGNIDLKTLAAATVFTGGLYEAFYSVIDGCDGIVAAGTYSTDGDTLAQRIASSPNNVIAQTDTSNAKQNGWGAPCNPDGSNYLITWIAQARGQGPWTQEWIGPQGY